jgi:hypothetical protein
VIETSPGQRSAVRPRGGRQGLLRIQKRLHTSDRRRMKAANISRSPGTHVRGWPHASLCRRSEPCTPAPRAKPSDPSGISPDREEKPGTRGTGTGTRTSTVGAISGLRASNLAPAFPCRLAAQWLSCNVGVCNPIPWRNRPRISRGSRYSVCVWQMAVTVTGGSRTKNRAHLPTPPSRRQCRIWRISHRASHPFVRGPGTQTAVDPAS